MQNTRPDSSHRTAGTEPENRTLVRNRLKRIEGQVRGIARMVEQERYCVDVLVQISAVSESLRKAGEVLLRDHLRHCVADAARSGDSARTEEIFDELMSLFNKYAR